MKSFPVAGYLNPALKALASQRIKQWDRNLANLQATQEAILLAHCQKAAQTEFGKKYNFEKIKSYADFKQALGLRLYAGFEPYLQRMRRGERDICLWER